MGRAGRRWGSAALSYLFDGRSGYRMPTHFGPSLGPRQGPGGRTHDPDETQRATLIWVSHAAHHEDIAAILPEGFEPAATPDLTVEIKNLRNIAWLAGRDYSVVTVSTGVRWLGEEVAKDGRLKLVLWENMADPIITGREELGYPKVFADISDIDEGPHDARAIASWYGFTFLDVAVDSLKDSSGGPPGGPSYHLHYMPRVGQPGAHGLLQTILTPPGQGALNVVERREGRGHARFRPGTWEQLPTLKNIVDGLAGLELGACLGAGLMRTAGSTDLRRQIIVAEAPDKAR